MRYPVILASALSAMLGTAAMAADIPYYTYEAAPVRASGVKVGVLTCHVAGGWGKIITSNKKMICEFRGSGRSARYVGSLIKVGVDVGVTSASSISWAVIAPSRNLYSHDLSGGYAGVSAEATVAAGLGVNVMLGGGDGSIALQPISVQSQSGLNVAAGISSMYLNPVYPVYKAYPTKKTYKAYPANKKKYRR